MHNTAHTHNVLKKKKLRQNCFLQLARPVDFGGFIQKICLPGGERTEVDKKCVIAGWGGIGSYHLLQFECIAGELINYM